MLVDCICRGVNRQCLPTNGEEQATAYRLRSLPEPRYKRLIG
jgi:hypothetical protein